MRKICEIKIKSLTPISVGSYDKYYEIDDKPVEIPIKNDIRLRPTEVRSLTRWWLRAIAGAAGYDMGLDEEKVAQYVQLIIFGGAGEKTLSSRIVIRLSGEIMPISENVFKKLDVRVRLRWKGKWRVGISTKHQRLTLLLMGIGDSILEARNLLTKRHINENELKEIIMNELRNLIPLFLGELRDTTIELYSLWRDPRVSYEGLVILSMTLGLWLCGIGKGARRGLGAIQITSISIKSEKLRYLEKEILNKNVQRVIKTALRFAKDVIEDAKNKKLISCEESTPRKGKSRPNLPKIPILHPTFAKIWVRVIDDDLLQKICEINNDICMRQGKIGLSLREIRNARESSKQLKHFVLGLPRSAPGPSKYYTELDLLKDGPCLFKIEPSKVTKDKKTGFIYKVEDREVRRASPLILSAMDEKKVTLTLFMSQDWPEKIHWYTTSNHGRIFEFNKKPIIEAYENLETELNKLLGWKLIFG